MRSPILLAVSAVCGLSFFSMTSCKKPAHQQPYTYTIYTQISINRSEIYNGINGDPNEPIGKAGKIYVKDNYIYINEIDKGIHVIDNNDPTHPFQTAFIKIPGNRDIAIKSNILYADMFSELLSLDIDDIHHVSIASDIKGVFIDRGLPYLQDTVNMVIGYIGKDTTVMQAAYPDGCANCETFAFASSASPNKSASGKAGSMARMVLQDDYLYAIAERHSLAVLDIREPETPKNVSTVNAGFDLETIFPLDNKLFLGSAIGMYMFDISDRKNPQQLGMFTHGRACDPVIADGNYAYVTLHSGSFCGGEANELDVIDIKDLMNPSLVKSYSMAGPKGLSKDGNLLFVCDGDNVVKVLDATDPAKITTITQINCPDPYDVITGDHRAMVVTEKGIYQYDYTNPSKIRSLSKLSTVF